MTINGYSSTDSTAATHTASSDPWFHFYWPLPGELPFISWWPYDDRNNPNKYAEANLPGTVQRTGGLTGVAGLVQTNPNHPLDPPPAITPIQVGNVPVPAQPATGAPGAGPTTNTIPPATGAPTNIPGSSTPTQVTTQSEPATGGDVNVGVSLSTLNWKGVAIALLLLWLLRRG